MPIWTIDEEQVGFISEGVIENKSVLTTTIYWDWLKLKVKLGNGGIPHYNIFNMNPIETSVGQFYSNLCAPWKMKCIKENVDGFYEKV